MASITFRNPFFRELSGCTSFQSAFSFRNSSPSRPTTPNRDWTWLSGLHGGPAKSLGTMWAALHISSIIGCAAERMTLSALELAVVQGGLVEDHLPRPKDCEVHILSANPKTSCLTLKDSK